MLREMLDLGFQGYAGDLAFEIDKVRKKEEVSSLLFMSALNTCI